MRGVVGMRQFFARMLGMERLPDPDWFQTPSHVLDALEWSDMDSGAVLRRRADSLNPQDSEEAR